MIFRGKNFQHNEELGQNGHLWTGTSWCPARNSLAFTLLEVLIAISILAIAFTTLFGSQSYSLSLATEAHFNITSTTLLRIKLAELEAGLADPVNDEGDFGDEFPGFNWQVDVTDAIFDQPASLSAISPPLQKIELTVSWEGTPYSQSITFYLASGEME